MSLLPLKDGNIPTFALLEHSKCVADCRTLRTSDQTLDFSSSLH